MRVMNKSIWPFQTRLLQVDSDEVYRWCEKNLYHGDHYQPNWYYNFTTSTWCFKDQKEFTMFCLRWGS